METTSYFCCETQSACSDMSASRLIIQGSQRPPFRQKSLWSGVDCGALHKPTTDGKSGNQQSKGTIVWRLGISEPSPLCGRSVCSPTTTPFKSTQSVDTKKIKINLTSLPQTDSLELHHPPRFLSFLITHGKNEQLLFSTYFPHR